MPDGMWNGTLQVLLFLFFHSYEEKLMKKRRKFVTFFKAFLSLIILASVITSITFQFIEIILYSFLQNMWVKKKKRTTCCSKCIPFYAFEKRQMTCHGLITVLFSAPQVSKRHYTTSAHLRTCSLSLNAKQNIMKYT